MSKAIVIEAKLEDERRRPQVIARLEVHPAGIHALDELTGLKELVQQIVMAVMQVQMAKAARTEKETPR